MASGSAKDGQSSEKTIAHYKAIAKNPLVGLIITEFSYIDVQGKASPQQMSFASDDVIESQMPGRENGMFSVTMPCSGQLTR